MTISGVALLAICTLLGSLLGDLLGLALGVKANVGGVGIAMMFLIAARLWLVRHGLLSNGLKTGVEFWGSFYIPIVVAMAEPWMRPKVRYFEIAPEIHIRMPTAANAVISELAART